MLIEILITFLLLLFVWINWRTLSQRWKLPPGPFPWPLFGNLMQLDPVKPNITMQKWSQVYGPVFTVWMGMQPTIIIADYDTMKDALAKHGDQLGHRPKYFAFEFMNKGNFGLITATGELFKEQRRFCLQTLKNFGLGRNVMEEKILFETKRLVESIRQDMGSKKEIVVNLTMPIYLCAANIILSLIFGSTFEKNDQRLIKMKQTIDENFNLLVSLPIMLLNSFTWLRHVPLFGHFGLDELRKHDRVFKGFVQTELEKHKKVMQANRNENEEPKDFSAAYFKEMKRRQREGLDMSHFSEWQLTCMIDDLWMAGMKCTGTTLLWLILAVVKYPRVQQKVHDEIDSVLGRDRLPTMSDALAMPYVTAAVHEVHRWCNMGPINFYHTNDTDFRLGGYTIPKDTHVIPQISCLAVDEKVYPRPQEFRPERFLADDEKTVKNVDRFPAYSLGKRQCTGESLARAELFLIFVHLLQKFHFSVAPGQEEPTAEPAAGIVLAPRDFECLLTLR